MGDPSGENPKVDYIDIEAPEKLVEGQDFFDQEPFRHILDDVSKKTPVDKKILSTLLIRYGMKFPYDSPVGSQEVSRMMQKPLFHHNIRSSIKHLAPGQIDKITGAVIEMGKQLEPYPDWTKYIGSQLSRVSYKTDGTFHKQNPKMSFTPVPTYPAWIAVEHPDRQSPITSGIETVFPQDFATESPALSEAPNRLTGQSRINRRWRIKKQL